MDKATSPADNILQLPTLKRENRPSVANQVFDILQQRILKLELPPLAKISETEVANRMGVSRQPVREAFARLARLGFLEIRPQSGTIVSLISEKAILRARFIRTALETQTMRNACETLTKDDIAALEELIHKQKEAVANNDRELFHALDEEFHREICDRSGVGYIWDLIHDHKAHMDRIRMLSLTETSQKLALNEHIEILEAIANNKPDLAAAAVTTHLSRILVLIEQIKAENHDWFTDQSE